MDGQEIAAVYDAGADRYAEEFWRELDRKPFDRAWLDRLIEFAAPRGQICDMGRGPGQIAAYLRCRGAEVIGVDLSTKLVEEARRLNPGLEFRRGTWSICGCRRRR